MTKNENLDELLAYMNRQSSTTTRVVEKPVIREVEAECPPCPDCREQIIRAKKVVIDGSSGEVKAIEGKEEIVEPQTGKSTLIYTSAEKLKGHYFITELDNLIASHDAFDFGVNPKYPSNCQERDYDGDSQIKGNVINNAKHFNPIFLLNEDTTAANGSPIINNDYVVLGGNSRTMVLQRVRQMYPSEYRKYVKDLLKRLSIFGFSDNALKGMKYPVLVRKLTNASKSCAYYSRILNTNLTNTMDDLSLAVSYARLIPEDKLLNLSLLIDQENQLLAREQSTITQLLNTKAIREALIDILRSLKIINEFNYSEFVKNDKKEVSFTERGNKLVSNLLIAYIVNSKTLIQNVSSWGNVIIKNMLYFLRITTYSGIWNITSAIREAFSEEHKRRRRNDGIKVANYIKEGRMNNSGKMEFVDDLTGLIMLLFSSKQGKIRTTLQRYCDIANRYSKSEGAMFGLAQSSPEKVLRDLLIEEKLSDITLPPRFVFKVNGNKLELFVGEIKVATATYR